MSRCLVIGSLCHSLVNFRGELLDSMRQKGVEVIACAPGGDTATEAELARRGIRFVPVPMDRAGMNPVRDFRTLWHLFRLMRREKPTHVLAYTIKPVLYGGLAARLAGRMSVVSILTGMGSLFVAPGARARLLRAAVEPMLRLALSRCSRVLVQNPDDRNLVLERRLVPSDKITLIAGSGVNLDHFRRELLPDGPVRFLMIARMLVEKGMREYVNAARAVKARIPEAEFEFVGPRESHTRAIPDAEVDTWEAEGVIRFHGMADDVRPHLRDCSIYVLPSYREGTPRSVLEALSVGRPVITTDAPGCRTTVTDGVNGYLVPCGNSEALAAAMERMAGNRAVWPAMSDASRQLAEQVFDVRRVNDRILEAMGL